MNEAPVVQHMILCEDARFEGEPKQLNLYGLTLRLNSRGRPFPKRLPRLCVFLVLRNGRGKGVGHVSGFWEDTGKIVCRSAPRRFDLGNDPLKLRSAYFMLNNTVIPAPGAYTFEFRYNGVMLATQSLDVLGSLS